MMKLEKSRRVPLPGYPALPDIPGGRYTDLAFAKLEHEFIWHRSWLFAGHISEIPEPGCHKVWDIAGQPIALVHARSGQVNAFYNSCRHRGAPVIRGPGKKPRLVCGYHGWTYDDEGRLAAVRHPEDFADLDFSCRSLKRVRCDSYRGFLFVNFDPHALPLRDTLGSLAEEWDAAFEFERYRLVDHHLMEVESNWKIAMESNMEVYHVECIHPATVAPLLDCRANLNTLYPEGHGRMIVPNRDSTDLEELSPEASLYEVALRSYNLFPNMVCPITEDLFPIMLFWPDGPTRSKLEFWWFGRDWDGGQISPTWRETIDGFDIILQEDMQFCAAIQRSQAAHAFEGVPLSYQEERIYYWHQIADSRIGHNRVPEALRVSPGITDDWIGAAGVKRRAGALASANAPAGDVRM